jgi:hypothetical protein
MIRRDVARLLCAAGLSLCALAPGRALAQDDATVEEARARFREGVQFYDEHQYDKARLAFKQAYYLKPHPSVLLNWAQSELRSGHPDDAANHFAEYLRGNPEASDAEKEETEVGFSAAKSKVSEVTINVDLSGAQIKLDGVDKGAAPLPGPIYVMPGSHKVEARSGDKVASRTFNANAGQTMNANLSLAKASAAPTPAPSPAEGAEQEEQEPLPEVKHPHEEPPTEAPAEPAAPEPEPASGGRKPFFTWVTHTPPALVGVGVTVLGAAGAVTFALLSQHDYSNANDLHDQILGAWKDPQRSPTDEVKATAVDPTAGPCKFNDAAVSALGIDRANRYRQACSNFSNDSSSGDTMKTLAIVSGAVGGAALIGTVVYYFADSGSHNEAASTPAFRARLSPMLSPGTSGLSIVGQF